MALPSCTSLPFKAIDMWSIGQEPRLCHNSGCGSECERERLPVCWFILRDVHLHRAAFWCSLRKIDDDVSYYGFLPVYLFDSETSSWNSTAVFLFHLFHWTSKTLNLVSGWFRALKSGRSLCTGCIFAEMLRRDLFSELQMETHRWWKIHRSVQLETLAPLSNQRMTNLHGGTCAFFN